MIVDDEKVMREFLGEVLGSYEITSAADGGEAISHLKERDFDLIITDLKMPRVSGEEVVRFAIQKNPNYKVIVISGYSSLFTASQSIENGACAFLSKPFSIQQLRTEVTKSLDNGGEA